MNNLDEKNLKTEDNMQPNKEGERENALPSYSQKPQRRGRRKSDKFLSDPLCYFLSLAGLFLYLFPAVLSFAKGNPTIVTVAIYFRAVAVVVAIAGFLFALRSRRRGVASESQFLFSSFIVVFCVLAALVTFATGTHLFLM